MKVVIQLLAAFQLVQVFVLAQWDHPKPARPGQFPHQASIFWGTPPEIPLAHSCGGAIIDDFWIISSGYCVAHVLSLNTAIIKVGMHNINQSEGPNIQTLHIDKGIVHEKYRGMQGIASLAAYDLGLIKTTEQIVMNAYVQKVQLPKKTGFIKGKYKLEYNLVLCGWGSMAFGVHDEHPQILYTVSLPGVPNKVCELSIRNIIQDFKMDDTQMCTRPLDGTLAACIGDYGGPLIQYDSSNVATIIGVMGWSIMPCDTNGLPPIYARIPHFFKWIKNKMES